MNLLGMRAPTDQEILSKFGPDAESLMDFARMVDRECSRSTMSNRVDEYDRQSYEFGMTSDHHSRSDIVRLVGIDNDVFTVWLRHGLIVPIDAPAGRGRALRFDLHQVRVAKVLANARSSGLSLDALTAIAAPLQAAIKVFLSSSGSTEALSAIIEEIENPGSFQGNLENLRRIYDRHEDTKRLELIAKYEQPEFRISVLNAASVLSKSDIDNLWLCLQLVEAEGFLMVYWSDQEGLWKLDRRPPLDGGRLPAPVCILFDLAELAALPNGRTASTASKTGAGGQSYV
jgi:hypothetical protein